MFKHGNYLFRPSIPPPAQHLRPSPSRPRVAIPEPDGGFLSIPSRFKMCPRNRSRTQKRKRRRGRGIIRRRLPRTLWSREKVIHTKMVDSYSSAGGASGAIEMRQISAMNVNDPFGGSSTQQFLGFDQWKTLYKKACVLGIKITARLHNKGSVGAMFGISAHPENQANTALDNFEHYMEIGPTKARLLSPDVDHGILTFTINTRRHLHLKSLRDEDAFHCNISTDVEPSRTFYLAVWHQPVDQATQCAYEVVLTYDYIIRLFDPIIPARSTD